jgi:hypothetical protein
MNVPFSFPSDVSSAQQNEATIPADNRSPAPSFQVVFYYFSLFSFLDFFLFLLFKVNCSHSACNNSFNSTILRLGSLSIDGQEERPAHPSFTCQFVSVPITLTDSTPTSTHRHNNSNGFGFQSFQARRKGRSGTITKSVFR